MANLISIIAAGDHRQVLKQLRDSEGEEAAIRQIKFCMEQILDHYIECTWGACYNTKFKDLIKPYLDDVPLLDRVLRSSKIREKPTVIVGKTGAKGFGSLLENLSKCDSKAIRTYLNAEFDNKPFNY